MNLLLRNYPRPSKLFCKYGILEKDERYLQYMHKGSNLKSRCSEYYTSEEMEQMKSELVPTKCCICFEEMTTNDTDVDLTNIPPFDPTWIPPPHWTEKDIKAQESIREKGLEMAIKQHEETWKAFGPSKNCRKCPNKHKWHHKCPGSEYEYNRNVCPVCNVVIPSGTSFKRCNDPFDIYSDLSSNPESQRGGKSKKKKRAKKKKTKTRKSKKSKK